MKQRVQMLRKGASISPSDVAAAAEGAATSADSGGAGASPVESAPSLADGSAKKLPPIGGEKPEP